MECTCYKPGGPDPIFRVECPVHGPSAQVETLKAELAQVRGELAEAMELIKSAADEFDYIFSTPVNQGDESMNFGEWFGYDVVNNLRAFLHPTPEAGEKEEDTEMKEHSFGNGKRIFDWDYDSSSWSTMLYTGRYEGDVTQQDIISYLGDGTFGHRGPIFNHGRFTYTKITD
jgi:hypothetical protein